LAALPARQISNVSQPPGDTGKLARGRAGNQLVEASALGIDPSLIRSEVGLDVCLGFPLRAAISAGVTGLAVRMDRDLLPSTDPGGVDERVPEPRIAEPAFQPGRHHGEETERIEAIVWPGGRQPAAKSNAVVCGETLDRATSPISRLEGLVCGIEDVTALSSVGPAMLVRRGESGRSCSALGGWAGLVLLGRFDRKNGVQQSHNEDLGR
jgi:hypothetical protein